MAGSAIYTDKAAPTSKFNLKDIWYLEFLFIFNADIAGGRAECR